ncbi:UNVERIFIED_CONTAM: dnaN [Trichonephila clavipes]
MLEIKFTINREILLKPLQLVTAVIERRQTLPILSNLLIQLNDKNLSLMGTDMEVELNGRIILEKSGESETTTAQARKRMDIYRSLPEGSDLQCGHSRFDLSTLPATDFPISEALDYHNEHLESVLSQKGLRSLIESTSFAMAQQDVRSYLNGMQWELSWGSLRDVATDGHRLALYVRDANLMVDNQIIVPRKAIYELLRKRQLNNFLTKNQLRVQTQNYTFTSKLIDGTYPYYNRVIPKNGDETLEIDRDLFKSSPSRVGVLSNDKHKSVCIELKNYLLRIFANTLEHEEAEDLLDVSHRREDINIAFNINYIIDVLHSLPSVLVKITLISTDESVRFEAK